MAEKKAKKPDPRLEALKPTCQNCKAFKRDPDPDQIPGEATIGECHRRAPGVVMGPDGDSETTWPIVFADEWCLDRVALEH